MRYNEIINTIAEQTEYMTHIDASVYIARVLAALIYVLFRNNIVGDEDIEYILENRK